MASEWNKTAFVEFETMLRRHLRSGAAPVAACAGFDLDAASAYLEGALGGSHRAGYESHLAGCATCRRHLIELARLAETAPLAEAQPVTAPDRIPAWNRWKGAVAVWFDLSSRNFKWQMAGAAGAAFAILIAALVAQSWRQASNYADVKATASATPPISVEPGVQLPTAEPSPQDTLSVVATSSSAAQHEQSQVPVPTPPVEPKANAPDFAVLDSGERLSLNQPSEAPVARPDGSEARRDLPRQPSDFVGGGDSSKASRSVLDFRESAKEVAKETQGLRISPFPKDNPMNLEPWEPDLNHETLGRMQAVNSRPESRPKPLDKPSSVFSLGPIAEAIKRRLNPSRKSSFLESERKTKPDKREEPDDEALKPMQVVIRDKIFCFEKCKGPDLEKIRGMWIDREYDFEKQKWNVWTLKSGGDEYKQVLAAEPLLKEFFDHRPILIVWKNRIYKVLK